MKFSVLSVRLFAVIFCLFFIGCSRQPEAPQHPNVIIILLDTLRADHLGTYGYPRDTTPNIDRFAAENIKFSYAITAAPWTPASVASIFTGLYPVAHGMMPPRDRDEARTTSTKLSLELPTIAEVFSKAGYGTAALSSNPWIGPEFGFDRGFQNFEHKPRARADDVVNRGLAFVSELSKKPSPYFVYLHFMEPHDPYVSPAPFDSMYQGAAGKFKYNDKMLGYLAHYDGAIRYLDTEIGRFFEQLKKQGQWEKTLIIVLADHGEQFMEHGDYRHGFQLHNEELHVPLLVKLPTQERKSVDTTVSTVDIFSTLNEYAHLGATTKTSGVNLLDQNKIAERGGVLSEIRRVYSQKSLTTPNGQKLILQVPFAADSKVFDTSISLWKTPSPVGLFDKNHDYEERTPISDSALFADLRGKFERELELASKLHVKGDSTPASVSNETLDQLKSLGYLQ